jgi:hypothetical protein
MRGMSTKAPDVLTHPPSPMTALSLAEMHLKGWQLSARCKDCRINLRANLPMMIRAYGPDEIWWGKHPVCPSWECDGRLTYWARSITGGTWVTLGDAAPQRIVDIWLANKRRRDLGPR